MRFIIRQDAQEASTFIAEHIIKRINTFNPTHDRPFVLGLPTGSSPLPIYASLIAAHRAGRLSFRHVITFNMDEYVGLPDRDHPASYRRFMHENLFSHIDIQSCNINLLDGYIDEDGDEDSIEYKLEAECAAYEARIKSVGGIHLFLGGVGSDGHIAFNEPGSSLASRTRVKALTQETRVANARFFDSVDEVPHLALTVGVQTIMDSREVVIIATGAAKALAVKDAVEGGVSHACTLSCLQLHAKGLVVADEEAVGELRYKTVNYFKDVEQTMQIKHLARRSKTRSREQEQRTKGPKASEGTPHLTSLTLTHEPSEAVIVEEPDELLREQESGALSPDFRVVGEDADEEEPDLMPDNMASRIKGFGNLPIRSATFPSVFLRALD